MHKFIVEEEVLVTNYHKVFAKDTEDAIKKINSETLVGKEQMPGKVIATALLNDMTFTNR